MSGIVGSYFNTRGSGIVAKLGTDGQVFTSTGAGLSQGFEAAAGGAYTLLSTATVSSAVSEVDISSNIDSTYTNYMFVLADIHATTDASRFQIQFFSSGGSPDTGSHYAYAGSGHRSDDTAVDTNSAGTTEGEISIEPCSVDAGHRHSQFVLYLFNPSGTDSYKQLISHAQQSLGEDKFGVGEIGVTYKKTIAVTGVRFKMASGNIDRGTFKLYGIS